MPKLIFHRLKKITIYALDTKWPILGGFRIRGDYLIFPYLFKKRQLSFFRLSLFLRLLKKCIIHALHRKLPILGDFRIRVVYPIISLLYNYLFFTG